MSLCKVVLRNFMRRSFVRVALLLAILSHAGTMLAQDTTRLNYLYQPGNHNYSCFRIPAMLNTSKGTLLAFAEARKNGCGDSGDIDLVLRRSADGGKTWTDLQVVWSDSTNTCGNPVPVEDVKTGIIWLVCSWNFGSDHEKEIRDQTSKYGRRAFVLSSSDDGKTWSAPTEITAQAKLKDWTWYATGPCHGLQLSSGKYAGRLIVPVNHVDAATGKNYASTLYSDNDGKSWKLGKNTPVDNANETTMAEIDRGYLMLNSRNSDRKVKYRQVAISTNGGKSWQDMHLDSTLTEPICQGSLLSYKLNPNHTILFFCNPSSQTARANLTLRMSYDNGQSWPVTRVIHAGPSAYSDIAVNAQNNIALLYEGGSIKPYEGIAFMVVNDILKNP